MRIGLVGDTHLPRFGTRLPAALRRGLTEDGGVELILHLGDLTTMLAAALFEEIAPFDAVSGNNDDAQVVERYGRRKLLSVEGVTIGMVHGDGRGKTTLRRAIDAFSDERPDVIGFGHSHIPHCDLLDGTWVVNPGSPTDKRRNPAYSYAILQVDRGRAIPTLHFYDDRSP